MRRILVLTAVCAAVAVSSPSFLRPASAQQQPQQQPAGGKRTAEQIGEELSRVSTELNRELGNWDWLKDVEKRKVVGPKAAPLMKRMNALFDEWLTADPTMKAELLGAKLENLVLWGGFGDAEAVAALDALANGADPVAALAAKAERHVVDYLAAGKDEAKQFSAVDEVAKIAKANPTSDALLTTLTRLAQLAPATPAVTERAEDVITTTMTSDAAKDVGNVIKGMRKLRQAIGKPFELAGLTPDGKPFSTKDWKGKVVLVDFWATWCPPCVAALPKVKKLYLDYHAKGLEVVGVTSDDSMEDVNRFMERNRGEYPWPQLFEPNKPAEKLHALAREWGIGRLPAMFLIDRKGVLRAIDLAERDSATGKERFETEVPKIMAEKAE